MVTDLVQIRRLGEKKRAENGAFRKHLKRHGYVEVRLRRTAGAIQDAIDCTACANCCKVATTSLLERDVVRLAKFLRIPIHRFLADYCEETADEGLILKRTAERGCVFLDGTLCSVYEARPSTCEDFPHTVRGAGSIESRMWQLVDRATYCPIVYNTLEAWKSETGFAS